MATRTYIAGTDIIPRHLTLGAGEELELCLAVLPGVSCEIPLQVDITGPGASLGIYGVYLCGADEQLSFDINVRHLSGGSVSRQLLKGIVGGRARVGFHGMIYVQRDAQQTKAYQENHNILLSDQATVATEPQLEIYADDVECSHGATAGALDEAQLFYLRSRGVPLREARAMQMLSFVSPVLEHLGDSALREKILSLVAGL